MMSLKALFCSQLQREYYALVWQKKNWLNAIVFFILVLIFLPLTMPADPDLLRTVAPAVVWIALLLSGLLAAERLFQTDYEDGVMEQWLVASHPISILVLAKISIHWVTTLIPILFFMPVCAVLFGLHAHEALILSVSLLCGTPSIVLLCALAGALGTSLPSKGTLMGLILLPLAIPVMIIGAATTHAVLLGLPVSAHLASLLALSCFAIAGIPWAIASVIRTGMTA